MGIEGVGAIAMMTCVMAMWRPVWSGAQPPSHTVWEAGSLMWCGMEDDWMWTLDSMAVHTLNVEEAGTRVLWGCATTWPESGFEWQAHLHWQQGVAGSNANRSALIWAEAPSSDPAEAVAMLFEDHLAGWLDHTGGVSVGMNGQADPLICHAPEVASWVEAPDCHAWFEPFTFRGHWTWTDEPRWIATAEDEDGRRDTWVDTVTHGLDHPPCLGLEVTHTSSHGNQWAFGWKPLEAQPDTLALAPDPVLEFQLVEPDVVQAIWPLDTIPMDFRVRHICEGLGHPNLSVSAQPTSCENVWQWPLPCPLETGASASLNQGENSYTIWSDGTDLLTPDHLCFTEIMADPTPALYAPPSTYLEVLNDSPWAIQPERLLLLDSDELHALQWVTRPEKSLLLPGERMVLVDNEAGWTNAPYSSLAVVRVSGWSGLRDEGESVFLQSGSGIKLEGLTFWDSWWGDTPQDGHSLSCVHPHACDHPRMWMADPQGASPGQPSTLEGNDPGSSSTFTMTRSPEDVIELTMEPPLHTDQIPWMQWHASDHEGGSWGSWHWDLDGAPRWKFPFPFSGTQEVSLHLQHLVACHPGHTIPLFDTLWTSYRPPAAGDIQLSEILPVSHPVVDAEFVEWANVSKDTLSWGAGPWPPGTALVQSSQPRERFATWMSDSLSGLWQTIPDLALTNAEGFVMLEDAWGNILASSTYSECGHDRRQGAAEGRSLEHHPSPLRFDQPGLCGGHQHWRTNPDESGMSPGVVSDWAWDNLEEALAPSWGALNGHWVMTVPQGATWRFWTPEQWEPPTTWTPLWHRGVLLAEANSGPEDAVHGPQHLTDSSLSFPLTSPSEPGLFRTLPTWNEVLVEPRDGFGTFVEWETSELTDWTADYAWCSIPWAEPGDFEHVADVTWWLPPSSTVCFSECPTWVEAHEETCLSAHVPSLHGERLLTLRTPAGSTTLDVAGLDESAWVTQRAGVSLARIPATSQWTSTPPPQLATPGRVNGVDPRWLHGDFSSTLQCTPSTLQPGAQWDKVELTWTPHEDHEASEYHLSYGVFAPHDPQFMQQYEAHWAGGSPFQWTWDATRPDGHLAWPGSYLGVLSWHNLDSGKRGTEKCIIGVAPP